MRFRDRFPIPAALAERMSRRAVIKARHTGPRRTGRGVENLRPMRRVGEVGIRVPNESKHLIFQEEGIRPFTMTALEGKTIPIRDASGHIHFRAAYGKSAPGRRKITSRDEQGRILDSKVMWRHPGIKPKHFMRDAVREAITETFNEMTKEEIQELLNHNENLKEFFEDMDRPFFAHSPVRRRG